MEKIQGRQGRMPDGREWGAIWSSLRIVSKKRFEAEKGHPEASTFNAGESVAPSHRGFCPPGVIWQCLETFFIVTAAGGVATGGQQIKSPAVHQQQLPDSTAIPAKLSITLRARLPGVSGAEEKEPGAKARDVDADQRPRVVLEPEKLIQKFLWKNMWD